MFFDCRDKLFQIKPDQTCLKTTVTILMVRYRFPRAEVRDKQRGDKCTYKAKKVPFFHFPM
jgi:hypothetical protein